ncbi:MAG: aminoacyl-histidine dipeptidase [Lachnospiraceae bacterium]
MEMNVLKGLKPENVFKYFEEICSIPHGSGETRAISDYLVAFAKNKGLKYRQDDSNNVIIWKKASVGCENAPTVMIQGHMDMVCEKDDDCAKDMSNEGLDLFVEGDRIGARGTTLGGDDGIAVAMALAVLEDDSMVHGPLECLFTVDEEIGLIGAGELDVKDLKASYMLNIDSEKEKVLTVSCAGSARILCRIPIHRESFQGEHVEVYIEGLIGGHSGEEIHMCRANANVQLGRILHELSNDVTFRIVSITGGAKDNAIPRSAQAIVATNDADKMNELLAQLEVEIRKEYQTSDGGIRIGMRKVKNQMIPMDADSTKRSIGFLFCVPNGVQNMSADVPGLVQTSLNLGRVYMEDKDVVCSMMLRSSVNSQKRELLEKVTLICECLGGNVTVNSNYSAWEYRPNSPLRDKMSEAFRELYGEEPAIEALHAGLECGILSGKMPDLDCISFGPDLTDIHTPRERLHIASTQRTWELLVAALKKLAE